MKFLLLVGLIYIQQRFPKLPEEWKIPDKYLYALFFYITGVLIIDFSRLALIEIYLRRYKEKAQPNFILGINRIASIISFIILLLTALIIFDIELYQVFTSLSIVAAAIAIVFKDYISNFINGLIIMFSDELSLGDFIEISEHKGQIIDITLMNIHLLSDDDELILLPNNSVLSAYVINYTKREVNRIGFEFCIEYRYLGDVSLLEDFIRESLREFDEHVKADSHNLKTVDIQKDFAVLKYQYTLNKTDRALELQIRRKIARRIIEFISQKAA